MTNFLLFLQDIILGIPAVVMILGIGLLIGARTRFVQLRLLPKAVRELVRGWRRKSGAGGISPFQSLCTALAATVGTGNLVGVAGAVCLGGPGAVFWMWISGILGMGTKYAEVTLALRYRVSQEGSYTGGPMYMITRGLGRKWMPLARLYACLGIAASFGVGNTAQINALVWSVNSAVARYGGRVFPGRTLGIGLLVAAAVGLTLLGGAKRIGQLSQILIPFLSGGYILLCAAVLFLRRDMIGHAFSSIFLGAFSPRAVSGGLIGSFLCPLRVGCSRGIFTNEAGMGTASIAHAGADTGHPAQQGLLGIVEVFLDTLVMCTMTALVILVSGAPIPYGEDGGGSLSVNAFSLVLGDWVSLFLAAALCCFAFSTVLGWGLYGARCAQFLFGPGAWGPFALAQTLCVIPGALLETGTLWRISELLNGAMAIPNLIALGALLPELRRLTIEYERKSGGKPPVEVKYADFHQCKPL